MTCFPACSVSLLITKAILDMTESFQQYEDGLRSAAVRPSTRPVVAG